MLLDWGFYYDAWLIDKVPSTLPIEFEEHPNGFKINPEAITMYFGANPTYIYGEGKLYHEVLFADLGILPVPFVFGRPGLEFIDYIDYDLYEGFDWLGKDAQHKKVGRVKVDDMIKSFVKKVYGFDSEKTPKAESVSSELQKMDDASLKLAFTPDFTPIFDTLDDFKNTLGVCGYIPMYPNESGLRDYLNGYYKIDTPYNVVYTKQGILKPVLDLNMSRINITPAAKQMFENADEKIYIFFKTTNHFNEGTVFDYSATYYYNEAGKINTGFRLELKKNGIKITSNSGNKTPDEFFIPMDIDFKTPRAFVINMNFDKNIVIHMNDQDDFIYKVKIPKPVFNPDDECILSGEALSNKYVQTGNFEEFGFCLKGNNESFKKFLNFNPFLQIADVKSNTDTPIPIVEGLTYSAPKTIYIPKGMDYTDADDYRTMTVSTTVAGLKQNIAEGELSKTNAADTIYLAKNKEVRKAIIENENDMFSKIHMDIGEYVYGSIGKPDVDYSGSTEYCKMLKKITSDTHIPVKITIRFKMPDWWTKDMNINMQLRMLPIGELVWYNYKKFKTGEWL